MLFSETRPFDAKGLTVAVTREPTGTGGLKLHISMLDVKFLADLHLNRFPT